MLDKLIAFFKKTGKDTKQNDAQSVLENAISDTSILITIAAKLGVQISEKDLSILLSVQNNENSPGLSTETQVQYWSAYERLLTNLKPVNIDNINAIYRPVRPSKFDIFYWFKQSRLTLADQSTAKYRWITGVSLFLIILLQIYWFTGSSLTQDVHTQNTMVASEKKLLVSMMQNINEDRSILLSFQKPDSGESPSSLTVKAKIEKLETQITNQKSLIELHGQWRSASILHLTGWNHIWSKSLVFITTPWEMPNYIKLSQTAKDRTQFVTAQFALRAVSEYLLPLLYGLLGTCFYILRKLPMDIQNNSFSKNASIRYSLRLSQGSLAGILCGFFFAADPGSLSIAVAKTGGENFGILTNLSPLAVAFLAGYSIDTFLKVMDRVISLMASVGTGKKENTTAAPRIPVPSDELIKSAVPHQERQSGASDNGGLS